VLEQLFLQVAATLLDDSSKHIAAEKQQQGQEWDGDVGSGAGGARG
jgi:hypothetical protein